MRRDDAYKRAPRFLGWTLWLSRCYGLCRRVNATAAAIDDMGEEAAATSAEEHGARMLATGEEAPESCAE